MSDRIRKINKTTSDDAKKIIDFIHYAEKLKTELRYASKSDNQRESVAEHTWRLSLILVLIAPKLKIKPNLLKALKLAIVHDIIEIEAKDVPVIVHINNKKLKKEIAEREKKAIKNIKQMLGDSGNEIFKLWCEYEAQETIDAKLVKAVDKLEGQMQFITESKTRFKKEEEESIRKMLNEAAELSRIDPFLIKLDEMTMPDRLKRTGLSNE